MRKEDFLDALRTGLSGLPQEEIGERLTFYGEMIDDRMEEGLPEEEAVAAVGTVDDVIRQISGEIPLTTLVKARARPKRTLHAGEIVLLVLGAPLWLPLLLAAAAVLLSLYVSLWAIVVSLWAVDLALAAYAFGACIGGVAFLLRGITVSGVAMLGVGVFCAGSFVFLFFGSAAAGKGCVRLTKKLFLGMKSRLMRKEDM